MFLDLKNIGPTGLQFERTVQVPELEGAGGEKVVVLEASIAGEVAKAPGGFDLEARLRATVATECSRCLEACRIVIACDVALTLVPAETGGEPQPPQGDLDEKDEALRFDCPEGKADLVQMVAEQIYLGLPLKPMCRKGCRGLCPNCGANRNNETCSCQGEWIDPRLAPLQRLRDTLKRD